MIQALKTQRDRLADQSPDQAKPIRKALDDERQGVRLLLIEDERTDAALAQELIVSCMPDYAFDIRIARTVCDAIEEMTYGKFDVALVDLGLKDVEGPQTIDVLCMVAPYLPMVVLSGTSNASVLDEALKRGAFLCMQKETVTQDEMRTALVSALSREIDKT